MTELQYKLADLGDVVALKNDYVFSLFMRLTDSSSSNLTKIMNLVIEYVGEQKKVVEVIVNDDDYLLMILKP